MRNHRLQWTVGGIVLLLIAFITWVGVREDASDASPKIPRPVVGTLVLVSAPPITARTGVPVMFAWDVQAPVGTTATHTAIHWGMTSHPGQLGTAVAPQASGYSNLLTDYARGSYALPRAFSGALTFPRGTVYYRAHAMVGGLHYWSPEFTVAVE